MSPLASRGVAEGTGAAGRGYGVEVKNPVSRNSASVGPRVPFSSDCAAPDLVAHLRQPAAPSPDRACPLAPHAVVMGSCQRRAAPVRNALRRVQGLEAAFWGAIAVLAAAPATRACLRDGHTCYGDVRPVVRRFATSRYSVGGEPRPAGKCDELSNNIESWTHATSTRLHGCRIRHAETNLRRRLDP